MFNKFQRIILHVMITFLFSVQYSSILFNTGLSRAKIQRPQQITQVYTVNFWLTLKVIDIKVQSSLYLQKITRKFIHSINFNFNQIWGIDFSLKHLWKLMIIFEKFMKTFNYLNDKVKIVYKNFFFKIAQKNA
jgi:LPS O-antigen subunit length determinant protein (WzzB/FepE family)